MIEFKEWNVGIEEERRGSAEDTIVAFHRSTLREIQIHASGCLASEDFYMLNLCYCLSSGEGQVRRMASKGKQTRGNPRAEKVT